MMGGQKDVQSTRTVRDAMEYARNVIGTAPISIQEQDSTSGSARNVKANKPSGKRRIVLATGTKNETWKSKSGATSSGKLPPYDLITLNFQNRVAARLQLGAEKHGRFNYRKGLKDKEFIMDRLNHAFNHLKRAMDLIEAGEVYQDDDLGGVAVNVMMAMEYQHVNGLTPSDD